MPGVSLGIAERGVETVVAGVADVEMVEVGEVDTAGEAVVGAGVEVRVV